MLVQGLANNGIKDHPHCPPQNPLHWEQQEVMSERSWPTLSKVRLPWVMPRMRCRTVLCSWLPGPQGWLPGCGQSHQGIQ